MKIALYVRVSTQDQNPDVQLEPLRAYAARRGTASEEFVDHGVSGPGEIVDQHSIGSSLRPVGASSMPWS